MTHPSTKKTPSNKGKDMVIVDLEATEESSMVDNVPEPQKSPINTYSQEGNLTLARFSHATDKEPTTPKCLETSTEMKWSMVPLSMPIDDLVSRCLGKTHKVKKGRIESRIKFDKNSKH